MPELPDVTVYVERLEALVGSAVLERVRLKSPFLLRSFEPPLSAVNGRAVRGAESFWAHFDSRDRRFV